MISLEKLKVLLYGETKDEFGRTNFPQRLETAKELEKELKALEVIKNKNVNVAYLKQTFLWNDDKKRGCEDYNCHFGYDDDGYHSNELTQEEYDLLKEVML